MPKSKTRTPPKTPYGTNKRLSQEEIAEGIELIDYGGEGMPKTRADCASVHRPCPYVRCRYNLYIQIKGRTIRLNFPHLDPTEMPYSCALDEADAHSGGMTLEEIGERMNITRERVRQLEEMVMRKLRWLRYAHHDTDLAELLDIWETVSNSRPVGLDWGQME